MLKELDARAYRKFVETISSPSDDSIGELFSTRLASHAAIVVKTLFQRAMHLVEILTRSLDTEIYGTDDVYIEALSFLERRSKMGAREAGILILYEDEIDINEHPFIREINDRGLSSGVMTKRVPPTVIETYSFHFMVTDKKHYRFTRQRFLPESINRFNDYEFGLTLHETFQKLWKEVVHIEVPARNFFG